MVDVQRSRRNLLLAGGVAVWLAASGWLAVSVYEGVRSGTAGQMAELEETLAVQASHSISDHLDHLERELALLAQDDAVVRLDARGIRILQRFYDEAGGEFQGITRMGPDGTIRYTWPNTASIGASIRGQSHVQRLLATHRPVLSDPFASVQGYQSIALHVPVTRDGVFDGSVAVLVPVSWIAERFVAGIRVGGAGYAWVLSRDGVEIYCPNGDQVGTNAIERPGTSAEERALAFAMARGASGTVLLDRDHASGSAGGLLVSYQRISLADTWWSIAVGAPENRILALMSGFVRPWVVAIVLLLAGIAAILFVAFRVSVRAGRRTGRQEGEADYRSLVEKLPLINYVVELGNPNRTVYISPQVQPFLGFTPEQWTSDPLLWLKQVHPDDRDRVEREIRSNDERGESSELEYRILTADGQVRWVHNRSIFSREGAVTTIKGIMMDVTERRHAEESLREREEQLQQARKLEAVGRLAGGVAHDFNNLLTVITGYADLLTAEPGLTGQAQEQVREILEAGRRAQALTDQLLAYSRKQVRALEEVDLNEQVSGMQGMLRRLIGEHLVLSTRLAPDLGKVRADPGQVQQVIMNLAVNARDSMGDGGTLTLTTANRDVDPGPVPGRPGLPPGRWIVLTVSDTGRGMDRDVLSHIFEPFYTTKEKGKGTGLGLSTVYGIVTQGGGQVFVDSVPGRGT
ncbi:MAG TPA: ATP-binding protein, partial [Spirochaetia bacterium]|nr:ATP-binding protein [Spirochaetia bacterium]